MSKKTLVNILSKLKQFENPKIKYEQYITNTDLAGELLWNLHMNQNIKEKSIIDLGCGTGILGIGCILLGAKKVTFLDVDKAALKTLKENLQFINDEFEHNTKIKIENKDVTFITKDDYNCDIVVQNPPFGTKNAGTDILFVKKAASIAKHVITIHKTSTKKFMKNYFYENNHKLIFEKDYSFPLKNTMENHQKEVRRIEVTGFIIKS